MEDHEIIRSMIRFENELINHRLTWMATLNGLLFTGLGFAWGKPDAGGLVYVFAFLGIAVAFLSGVGLFAANLAFRKQYDWWQEKKPCNYRGPDVIGLPPRSKGFGKWLTPWTLLPLCFLFGWIAILIINVTANPCK
jgi:hypothetical protein